MAAEHGGIVLKCLSNELRAE